MKDKKTVLPLFDYYIYRLMIPNSQTIEITLNSKFNDNPAKKLTIKQIWTLAKISIQETHKIVKNAPSTFYMSTDKQPLEKVEKELAYLNLMGVDIKITKGVESPLPNGENLLSEALDTRTSSLRLQEILIIYYLYLSEEDKRKDNQQIPLAIVSNPNTSWDILCQLAIKYPETFLQNSIVYTHLQNKPNFVLEIPHATLCSLIKTNDIPERWINFILENHQNRNFLIFLIKQYHFQLWQQWHKQSPELDK